RRRARGVTMSDTITTTDAPKGTMPKGAKPQGAKGKGDDEAGRKARKGPVVFGTLILILLVGTGLVFGFLWLLDAINYVSTDDAAIDGDHVSVSAKMLGRIAKLMVDEGDKAATGQLLVLLDDTDLRAQEAQASASLSYANRNVELSKINLDRAQSDADR